MSAKRMIAQYIYISLVIVLCTAIVYKASHQEISHAKPVLYVDTIRCVILDAGHGGKDGGAISVTGSSEKELNLDITLTIYDIMLILGYDVILTRDTDTELTHRDGGSRKMQDLKGRLQIAEDNTGIPFISIHMNKFPIEKYRGLQIYYSPAIKESQSLADGIRTAVVNNIDQSNKRSIKPSGREIYLLHNAVSPSVLIECGFLSNNEEAQLLDTPEYRAKLSTVIASAIDLWYNSIQIPKG